MHLLHSKQEDLFRNFCGNFMNPEALTGKLSEVNLADQNNQLGDALLFIGTECSKLAKSKACNKKEFLQQVRKAYVLCAESLQRKMPLRNKALKVCAALDPELRGKKITLTYLKKAPGHLCAYQNAYKKIRKYNVDPSIS
jgi:hypothetical protein